jgi:DNA-binding GntR family transcriptional regulator
LTEAIVTGAIPAGQKISEPDLANQYKVSRGPLREAIRRLEGRGLVQHIPHTGARVVTLALEEVVELYLVREALEGMAARLAAQHMRDEEVAAIRGLLDQHEKAVQRSAGREYFQQEGDLDFHYRIVQASNNEKLITILGGELYHLVRMYRYRSSLTASRPQRALAEHRRILDAIADRDGELAEMLMRRHLAGARKSIAAQLDTSET